jgi:PPM family protein phosphatase
MLISTAVSPDLVICEGAHLQIETFDLEIETFLGQVSDIYYFAVSIQPSSAQEQPTQALLRIGAPEGGLQQELQLREKLEGYKLVSQLFAHTTQELRVSLTRAVSEEPKSLEDHTTDDISDDAQEAIAAPDCLKGEEQEYLEEEYLEDSSILDSATPQLILLSELPNEAENLAAWLTEPHPLDEVLSITSQLCQLFRYISQQGWCFIQLQPKFIQVKMPIKIYDLTSAYPTGQPVSFCLMGEYCAPELAYSNPLVDERLSTYVLGSLLYQSIHQIPPAQNSAQELAIAPIPQIHQILKICLSVASEDRFQLAQLLSLLIEVRQTLRIPLINWEVTGLSTVGLSAARLQNEDSYGIRQHYFGNSESLVLGVVADGMGGMALGEVASKLAVETVLNAPIPSSFIKPEQWSEWLVSLTQAANEKISTEVDDGGTTFSLVLAVQQNLMVAHVGDSRILLYRNGQVCQLSEDHSIVTMMLASGQITYEESKNHPDQNILTKSLGAKSRLSEGYVQTLNHFGDTPFMTLQDGDILLLCSDGAWDLLPSEEFAEIFEQTESLQAGVNRAIAQVLSRGAHDNATIVALKCQIQNLSTLLQPPSSLS